MKKIFLLFLILIGGVCAAEKDKNSFLETSAKKYLQRAQVWHQVDIPAMDIMGGPQSDFAVPFDAEFTCTFEEPKEKPGSKSQVQLPQ